MDPLHSLLAQNDIRRLLSLYCDAVSNRDAEAIAGLFTPDAQVRIADLPVRTGTREIVEGLRRSIDNFSFLKQICDTGLIDVQGDLACARIGIVEVNSAQNANTVNFIYGQYEDEYKKLAEGWRFYRRKFSLSVRTVFDPLEISQFPAIPSLFPFRP